MQPSYSVIVSRKNTANKRGTWRYAYVFYSLVLVSLLHFYEFSSLFVIFFCFPSFYFLYLLQKFVCIELHESCWIAWAGWVVFRNADAILSSWELLVTLQLKAEWTSKAEIIRVVEWHWCKVLSCCLNTTTIANICPTEKLINPPL